MKFQETNKSIKSFKKLQRFNFDKTMKNTTSFTCLESLFSIGY